MPFPFDTNVRAASLDGLAGSGNQDLIAFDATGEGNLSSATSFQIVFLWRGTASGTGSSPIQTLDNGGFSLQFASVAGKRRIIPKINGSEGTTSDQILLNGDQWYIHIFDYDGTSQEFKVYENGNLVYTATGVATAVSATNGSMRLRSASSWRQDFAFYAVRTGSAISAADALAWSTDPLMFASNGFNTYPFYTQATTGTILDTDDGLDDTDGDVSFVVDAGSPTWVTVSIPELVPEIDTAASVVTPSGLIVIQGKKRKLEYSGAGSLTIAVDGVALNGASGEYYREYRHTAGSSQRVWAVPIRLFGKALSGSEEITVTHPAGYFEDDGGPVAGGTITIPASQNYAGGNITDITDPLPSDFEGFKVGMNMGYEIRFEGFRFANGAYRVGKFDSGSASGLTQSATTGLPSALSSGQPWALWNDRDNWPQDTVRIAQNTSDTGDWIIAENTTLTGNITNTSFTTAGSWKYRDFDVSGVNPGSALTVAAASAGQTWSVTNLPRFFHPEDADVTDPANVATAFSAAYRRTRYPEADYIRVMEAQKTNGSQVRTAAQLTPEAYFGTVAPSIGPFTITDVADITSTAGAYFNQHTSQGGKVVRVTTSEDIQAAGIRNGHTQFTFASTSTDLDTYNPTQRIPCRLNSSTTVDIPLDPASTSLTGSSGTFTLQLGGGINPSEPGKPIEILANCAKEIGTGRMWWCLPFGDQAMVEAIANRIYAVTGDRKLAVAAGNENWNQSIGTYYQWLVAEADANGNSVAFEHGKQAAQHIKWFRDRWVALGGTAANVETAAEQQLFGSESAWDAYASGWDSVLTGEDPDISSVATYFGNVHNLNVNSGAAELQFYSGATGTTGDWLPGSAINEINVFNMKNYVKPQMQTYTAWSVSKWSTASIIAYEGGTSSVQNTFGGAQQPQFKTIGGLASYADDTAALSDWLSVMLDHITAPNANQVLTQLFVEAHDAGFDGLVLFQDIQIATGQGVFGHIQETDEPTTSPRLAAWQGAIDASRDTSVPPSMDGGGRYGQTSTPIQPEVAGQGSSFAMSMMGPPKMVKFGDETTTCSVYAASSDRVMYRWSGPGRLIVRASDGTLVDSELLNNHTAVKPSARSCILSGEANEIADELWLPTGGKMPYNDFIWVQADVQQYTGSDQASDGGTATNWVDNRAPGFCWRRSVADAWNYVRDEFQTASYDPAPLLHGSVWSSHVCEDGNRMWVGWTNYQSGLDKGAGSNRAYLSLFIDTASGYQHQITYLLRAGTNADQHYHNVFVRVESDQVCADLVIGDTRPNNAVVRYDRSVIEILAQVAGLESGGAAGTGHTEVANSLISGDSVTDKVVSVDDYTTSGWTQTILRGDKASGTDIVETSTQPTACVQLADRTVIATDESFAPCLLSYPYNDTFTLSSEYLGAITPAFDATQGGWLSLISDVNSFDPDKTTAAAFLVQYGGALGDTDGIRVALLSGGQWSLMANVAPGAGGQLGGLGMLKNGSDFFVGTSSGVVRVTPGMSLGSVRLFQSGSATTNLLNATGHTIAESGGGIAGLIALKLADTSSVGLPPGKTNGEVFRAEAEDATSGNTDIIITPSMTAGITKSATKMYLKLWARIVSTGDHRGDCQFQLGINGESGSAVSQGIGLAGLSDARNIVTDSWVPYSFEIELDGSGETADPYDPAIRIRFTQFDSKSPDCDAYFYLDHLSVGDADIPPVTAPFATAMPAVSAGVDGLNTNSNTWSIASVHALGDDGPDDDTQSTTGKRLVSVLSDTSTTVKLYADFDNGNFSIESDAFTNTTVVSTGDSGTYSDVFHRGTPLIVLWRRNGDTLTCTPYLCGGHSAGDVAAGNTQNTATINITNVNFRPTSISTSDGTAYGPFSLGNVVSATSATVSLESLLGGLARRISSFSRSRVRTLIG